MMVEALIVCMLGTSEGRAAMATAFSHQHSCTKLSSLQNHCLEYISLDITFPTKKNVQPCLSFCFFSDEAVPFDHLFPYERRTLHPMVPGVLKPNCVIHFGDTFRGF